MISGANCNGRVLRTRSKRYFPIRSEEHTSELQSQSNLVCRLLLEKKKKYQLHLLHGTEHYLDPARPNLDTATNPYLNPHHRRQQTTDIYTNPRHRPPSECI